MNKIEIKTTRDDNNTYKIELFHNGRRQGATLAASYSEAIGLRNVLAENASDIADSVHAHPIPEPTV
jgi:hypothetical protein